MIRRGLIFSLIIILLLAGIIAATAPIGIHINIFTFSPVRATADDLPRFHGTNERISIKNYAEMIRFYHQLLINSSRQ